MADYVITPFCDGIEFGYFQDFDGKLIDAKLKSRQMCYDLQMALRQCMVTVQIEDEEGRVRHVEMVYIPINYCIEGNVYRIRARNSRIGIFMGTTKKGKNVFALSRHKGNNFIDYEEHWDSGHPHGTVMPLNSLGEAPSFKTDSEKLTYLNSLVKEVQGIEYPEFPDIYKSHKFKAPDFVEHSLTNQILEALAFYANPETYFGIRFLPDPPCGEFMEDMSDTGDLGVKPGKKARSVLTKHYVEQ